MGGISIWQLLIVAVIVVLLFGTKNSVPSVPILARLSKALKAMSDDDAKQDKTSQDADFTAKSIADKQGEAKRKTLKAKIKSRYNPCLISVLANCC